MGTTTRVLVFVVLFGCGDPSERTPDATAADGGDGGDGGDGDTNGTTLRLTVQVDPGAPLFIALRDGTQPWELLPANAGPVYEINVHDRYQVVVVCGGSGTFTTKVTHAIAAEGDLGVSCVWLPPTIFTVSGTFAEAGVVSLGHQQLSSTTAPWSYSFDVLAGSYDLFYADATRVRRIRDVVIDDPTPVPAQSLATAQPFIMAPATFAGDASETASTRLFVALNSARGSTLTFPGTTLRWMPASMISPTEIEMAAAVLETPTTLRETWMDRDTDGVATHMPRLSVAFADETATWSTLPPGTIDLSITAPMIFGNRLDVTATPGAAAGATSLGADLAIAGYQNAWRVPRPRRASLTVNDDNPSSLRFTLAHVTQTP